MSNPYGAHGPARPRLGRAARRLALTVYRFLAERKGFHRLASEYGRSAETRARQKLARGESLHLLGIGPGGHDSGVALVRVTRARGIELLGNHEEERFTAKKSCTDFPTMSIAHVRTQLAGLGLTVDDLDACLASWDYVKLASTGVGVLFDELPQSFRTAYDPRTQDPTMTADMVHDVLFRAPERLGRALGISHRMPIIGMRHHENHAAFAYAASPFAQGGERTMVAVLDGSGDDGALSLFVGENGKLSPFWQNDDPVDSLGMIYSMISATQGGWKILQSEGRYMGAAAWGNGDRLTNPYYAQLRQILFLGERGDIRLNRQLASWHSRGFLEPYGPELERLLGAPILPDQWWNPDAILNVDDVEHSEITQDRVDKAAALQMVFEDGLFHLIGHFIRATKSSQLVLAGGCALNCVANMRLLDHFDEAFYARYVGAKDRRLHMWVPPTPSDCGVTIGAAYQFALRVGSAPGKPLGHAFYCGAGASADQVVAATRKVSEIGSMSLGDTRDPSVRRRVADLLAFVVSQDGVMGLFQGVAETGPRALGHRSIVANPRNPKTLETLNALVKYRERIRPLAPMATLEAAKAYWTLSEGASDADYNAYRYMILTARAKPEAYEVVPAVIHKDGTSRVQVVDESEDPFTFEYLTALGRRNGAEVSVNTSLNVGSPIVQTPEQALEALRRSKAMDGILMIADDGQATLLWHDVVRAPKDGGKRLLGWLSAWRGEHAVRSVSNHVEEAPA